MLNAILSVALGGALGSLARYGVNVASLKAFGESFPYGTMIVNIIGSFIIGAAIAVFADFWSPSENARLFIITGLLGGFTTFSSFSLDIVHLFQRQDYMAGAFYLGGSLILSIAALMTAMLLVKGISS